MKTVNPYETTGAISALYAGAKPPFFVADSVAEFNQIQEGNSLYIIIKNAIEFAQLIKKLGYMKPSQNYSLQEHNVWIATGELFVPDVYASTGQILYKLHEGKPIRTDNVFVQIFGFVGYNNMWTVATSSGLFNISAMLWEVSGAIKYNYKIVEADRLKFISTSKGNAERTLVGMKPKIGDLRFIYYMLFADMDADQAARKAYGSYMKKDDVKRLRDLPRIKKLITKELSVIIPNLSEEILKQYPIEEIAKDMKDIVKKTLDQKPENFNHKNSIEAMNFILENSIKATPVLSLPQEAPLVEGRKVTTIGQTTIHSADGEIVNLLAKQPDKTERATVLSEQEIRKTENDLGIPVGGYVMSDSPAHLVEPDKLFPDEKTDGQS